MSRQLENLTVAELLDRWPFAEQHLSENGHPAIADQPEVALTEILAGEQLVALDEFVGVMEDFLGAGEEKVSEITITGGRAKDGSAEPVRELTVKVGEVVCIVGPTGSGKSRLLADIEWVARGDTPTGRHVTINGQVPEDKWRFSSQYKLVAQLSQNMNFVMDLTVEEFLALHAESRQASDPAAKITRICAWANELAGEPFTPDTPVTIITLIPARRASARTSAISARGVTTP